MAFLEGQAKEIQKAANESRRDRSGEKVTTYYPDIPGANTRALGSDPSSALAPSAIALSEAVEAVPEVINKVFNGSFNSGSRSVSGPSADAMLQANTMQQAMQDYINMINDTTASNNAWAADQAQKQMDFQERMARNAHQYEVEDLKAAGLNPVLSAGAGGGSAAPSGAMAQPDTSNTRLLAEMSMAAVDSLGNSAVQLASGSNAGAANNFRDKLLNAASKYFVPTLVRGAARAVTKGLFG